MRKPASHPAIGFTLVELMVVIAIVALMLAILLPALGKARESGKRAACMGNLRQIYFAFSTYAQRHDDQVPIGHRTASKQFNSMVHSASAGGLWVLFGVVYQAGDLADPALLFCPSESNRKFQFDTSANPWPAPSATPSANIQSGYAMRPDTQIPDDLANIPPAMQPFQMPRLSRFYKRAIFADLTAAAARVASRHREGVNALRADASVHWVNLDAFAHPEQDWPEPTFPPTDAYNDTQTAIWWALSR